MATRKRKKIGILTGGGDCPGLNAAIRAIVRKAAADKMAVTGFLRGWQGIIARESRRLGLLDVEGVIRSGGTILQTSRTNPFRDAKTEARFRRSLEAAKLDALLAIGGEDTLGVAARIAADGYPVIGIPKTIDNDLMGTDYTIGFRTAVSVATEAIDRLHTTAESHNRVIVLEVMGRHAGWIATYAGLAGGADAILIPEKPFKIKEVADIIKRRHRRGKNFSIVVVAEGAKLQGGREGDMVLASQEKDEFGHVRLGGISQVLAKSIEAITGFEARVVILGHLQRAGSPSEYDRILATRFGVRAVELVERKRFGRLVALRQGKVTDVALSVVRKGIKHVDPAIYKVAGVFFG